MATKPRLKVNKSSVDIVSCNHFDKRFDDFWEATKSTRPGFLLATRSQEILEWHFRYPLAQQRAFVATAAEGSRLVAYSLFLRDENPSVGLKRLRLIDFQSLGNGNELLIPMLQWGLNLCEAEGLQMLEAFGFAHDKQMIINRVAPYSRRLPSWQYFYKASDSDLAERLKAPNVWDPSCFDGDASL